MILTKRARSNGHVLVNSPKLVKRISIQLMFSSDSKEDLKILKTQKIEIAQGFFLSNPVQAKDMADMLKKETKPK